MDENNKEEFDYVTEKIRPQTKRKIKKILETIGLAIIAALVFGIVARITFALSADTVNTLLGIGDDTGSGAGSTGNQRTTVSFQTAATKTATRTPDKSATTTPASSDTKTNDTGAAATEVVDKSEDPGIPAGAQTGRDPSIQTESTPQPTMTETDPDAGQDNVSEDADANAVDGDDQSYGGSELLKAYAAMMTELRLLASRTSDSLVTVKAVTSGINWLDENIETSTELTGVLIGDNGVELLILTGYDKLSTADRIEIGFADGTLRAGTIYGRYRDLNMAVVAVRLDDLDDEFREGLDYISLGESEELYEGEPIIALGRPNGFTGAMEYGFVSMTGGKAYITDGSTEFFTTDIGFHTSSDGIIVNLNGELIGLIANNLGSPAAGGVSTAIGIDSIKTVLLKLLNGERVPYLGIRAEDIPADALSNMGLENGVYINEVITSSTAQSAGLRKGDVILSMNGELVKSMADFSRILMEITPGEWTLLNVYRSSMSEEPELELMVKVSYR